MLAKPKQSLRPQEASSHALLTHLPIEHLSEGSAASGPQGDCNIAGQMQTSNFAVCATKVIKLWVQVDKA